MFLVFFLLFQVILALIVIWMVFNGKGEVANAKRGYSLLTQWMLVERDG
jgi:hypothetical protein